MTAPADSTAQREPIRQESPPSSAHSIPDVPPARTLEWLQRYLAPLERLGNQRAAWLGAALLFFGVFLPAKAATIPFLNITVSASFWNFSKFESLVLILAALASAWLASIHDYKWLWLTGGMSLVFLLIEFFDALTGSFLRPSWAWLVLFPGVLLILAGAALKRDPHETSGDAVNVLRVLAQRAAAGR